MTFLGILSPIFLLSNLFFCCMSLFIYLLLLVAITYLILHKEMVERFWCLLEYCEFTLTQLTLETILQA